MSRADRRAVAAQKFSKPRVRRRLESRCAVGVGHRQCLHSGVPVHRLECIAAQRRCAAGVQCGPVHQLDTDLQPGGAGGPGAIAPPHARV